MKKIKLIIAALALSLSSATYAQTNSAETDSLSRAAATALTTALNKSISDMSDLGLEVDRATFAKALYTSLTGGDTGFTVEEAEQYLDKAVRKANHVMPDTVTPESQIAYLDKMAKEPGARRMPSGIIFTTIKEGTGVTPTDADKVSVECYAVLSDDSVFYETAEGEPDDYDVTGVIKGFAEGLKMMRQGGTYRVVIPSELAYGRTGIRGIVPGNAALNFKVKLVGVSAKEAKE
jgi:FKBP-type peptidyl-prolyl cis-trans isomerase